MPLDNRFELIIPRRPEDLDRWGIVSSDALLRLAEGVRWEAVVQSVFNLNKVFEDGKSIVVRSQELEVRQLLRTDSDLSYRGELSVSYWIESVGRSSIVVGQDIRTSDGTVIGELRVVGVCRDSALKSTPAPHEVRGHAHSADGPSFTTIFDEPINAEVAVLPVRVRNADIDVLQHVNHAVYLDYYVDAEASAADEGRLGLDNRLLTWPIRRVRLDYLKEAHAFDELAVRTWILSRDEHAVELAHEVLRDGEPVNRARITRRP